MANQTLYGPGTDHALARNGEYFLPNHASSTTGLTDSSGNLTQSYLYGPFGELLNAPTDSNPFQYTGRENDGDGLLYYRAPCERPPGPASPTSLSSRRWKPGPSFMDCRPADALRPAGAREFRLRAHGESAPQAAALAAQGAMQWVLGHVAPDAGQRHGFSLDPATVSLAEVTAEGIQATVEQVSRRPAFYAPGGFDTWALSARLLQFVPAP